MGGVWNFLFANQRFVFLPLPLSNSHCFRHPVRSERGKVQKVAKTCGESALSRRASPAMPHHLAWVRYCVLINAILLRWPLFRVDVSIEGGGGIGFYNNWGEEPNFSIFPESLGPKGSDLCSFQADGPPLTATLEPRRVRVTLIPGSTLVLVVWQRILACYIAMIAQNS